MPPPPAAPAVALTGLSIGFALKEGGRYTAVEAIDLAVAAGRVRRHRRPDGLREVDAAQRRRRAAAAVGRQGRRSSAHALAGLNARAGYLFQQDALMPWKTALDNVAVALEPKGVPRSRGRASGRGNGLRGSGSRPSSTAIRTCSRAASASASRWRRC